MAAFRPDSTVAGVSAARTIEYNPSPLPEGACNYRALDRGTKAPVCGCKRFWLDSSKNESADSVWCFCGHHGCFHNSTPVQSQRLSTQPTLTTHHETSPKHVERQTPEGYVSVKHMGALPVPTGLGIRHESRSQSQSINTRVWDALNGFARHQLEGGYSAHTSQLPSTAASVIGEPVEHRSMAPPITIPAMLVTRPGMDDYQGSATEVATPSMAGTPDPQGYLPPGTQSKCSPQRAQVTSPVRSLLRDSGHITQTQFSATTHSTEIMNMLKAHADRLNALEGLSFSHVPVEEVQDKFEIFDGRLLDIEQWRQETEVKATRLKKTMARERRLLPNEACSFASDESIDMTAAAHAEAAVLATIAASSEIGLRIEALEGRISDLEQVAMPSYSTPWQVEVVLLPWGRNLRGIWFPSLKSKQTQADTDEWTGAVSQVKTSFASTSSDAWTTESIQAWADNAHDWKSPKACGPSNVVFQRLASRGLIREVAITATDSRHIIDVLTAAFKHILPACRIETDAAYHGLNTPFIPLRKVRKSTRLRFLGKAEMITSATWTASFLDSSVFMKVNAGHRRLYITTPQAYIQTHDAGFAWQQLKSLPQRDSNGDEPAGQIDSSIAIEACWSYNDVLDQAPSLHSSFASQSQAAWSIHSASSSPDEAPGQLTPALSGPERPHKRTLSLPESASACEFDSLPKRRVASFEDGTTVPLMVDTAAVKRRRLSASQEAEPRGVGFTPRYSREPPSPFDSVYATDPNRKRATTPFAYATPHSGINLASHVPLCGDGDTVRDSEPYDSQGEDADDGEEWNGMDVAPVELSLPDELEEDDQDDMDEEPSN